MSATAKSIRALAAVESWLGAFEAATGDLTLEAAFEECGSTSKVVKKYGDQLDPDTVEGYALVRRMLRARRRAARQKRG